MSEVEFDMKPVDKKPSRRYRIGSKYDPILNAFMAGEDKLVKVTVKGKDSNYLRTQLNKRIQGRKLKIEISVVNGGLYLEK